MELKKAIETLQRALRDDESYRMGWEATISCAFQDAYKRADHRRIREIANNAACNFLEQFIRKNST